MYSSSLGNARLVHPFPSLSPTKSDAWLGKSVFLLWLLVRRLACKLPTALQINDYLAILFHESGVSQFTNPNDPLPHDILTPLSDERIWALVDIGGHFPEPTGIFKHSGPFFIVHAASPCSIRPRWLDEVAYKEFCLNHWSLLELLQA